MSSESFTLDGNTATLAARVDLPTGPRSGFALVAHCFTCSEDHVATSVILVVDTDGVLHHGVGDSHGIGDPDAIALRTAIRNTP